MREDQTPVSALMAREVFCARADASLEVLAHVMVDGAIPAAPVVDEAGRPIGTVSRSDLLRALHRARAERLGAPSAGVAAAPAEGADPRAAPRTAEDAMSPLVAWLREDATVAVARALMAWEEDDRVPVVDTNGRLVGVVAALDILRWQASAAQVAATR